MTVDSTPAAVEPRSRPARKVISDVLVAIAAFALDTVVFSGIPSGETPLTALAYGAIGFAALVWRRRAPGWVLGAVLVHQVAALAVVPTYFPTVSVLVALYTVSGLRALRGSIVALAVTCAVFLPMFVNVERIMSPTPFTFSIVLSIALLGAGFLGLAWGIGRWVRWSRLRMDTLELRRQRAAAEAVAAERSRIARELHDIVSHSVSVMVLQAAGARRVLERDPARAQESLSQIEFVGKQSMVELRRLLGVLRDGAFVQGDEPAEHSLVPQPGLGDLPALVQRFRSGGLEVTTEIQGTPAQLDASVDLSAYRVVQEALTNVVKHVGPTARVSVRQVWTPDLLVVEVSDEGGVAVPQRGLSAGYGLIGLRERARAVGGRIDTGPTPQGGFRVSVSLPVAQSASVRGAAGSAESVTAWP